jgi:hypothetical protein
VDGLWPQSVNQLGLAPGYSAYAMRAMVISTGFENAAQLEDVQGMVGDADPSTTPLIV